ncbi:MAG: MFS transporter [Acidimicrobiales bacterium]|nr:MFS transporter [Acidimicrobiales bacterium]
MEYTPLTAMGVVERDLLQRRTLRTLMAGLIPAGAGMSGAYSAAAILGEELSGSETLGGLAAAGMTAGSAVAAIPLARLMAARGRRPGLALGYLLGMGGAAACVLAALSGWYLLLVPGMAGIGIGQAANMAARFAAADMAPEAGRAIGTLVWASTFGSVLGPMLGFGPAKSAARAVGLHELSGPYLLSVLLFAVAAVVVFRYLRPDPLVMVGGVGHATERLRLREFVRPLATTSAGRLAVGSMVAGHVVMVGVMTMTPLHLRSGGHALEVVGFVISLHIIGMYALSPLVGRVADRLGARPVIAAGGVLLAVGAAFAAGSEATESGGVYLGLFLIGLGWCCGLVAGSTLLVRTFAGSDRVGIQGLADLCMTASGGLAGLGSGFMVAVAGYQNLSRAAIVVGLVPTVAVLAMLLSDRGRHRPQAA